MEFIVRRAVGEHSVAVDLSADIASHSVAELRMALGLEPSPADAGRSLAETGIHRAMIIDEESDGPLASAHLAAGFTPDANGRIAVIRPHYRSSGRPAGPIMPPLPEPPGPPPPIPFSTIVPMLAISGLMALLWSPMFAMLSASSAMIPLFRALGPRMMRQRSERRFEESLVAHQFEVFAAEATWGSEVTDWLEQRVSSPGDLDRRLDTDSVRPWTRRLAVADSLTVAVGRGALSIDGDPGTSPGPLSDAPLLLEIETGLAITGDRRDTLALARWIGIEVAYRHGPADLDMTLCTTTDRLADWEWIRWLPGLRVVAVDSEVARPLGAEPVSHEAAARAILESDEGITHFVFVDGAVPGGVGPFARLLGGHASQARLVWIGEPDEVPAGCEIEASVTADGFVETRDGHASGWTWRLTAGEAEEFARYLAPFTDPEVTERIASLPSSVPMARLCPQLGDGPAATVEAAAEVIIDGWSDADPRRLRVPLGFGSDGPVEVDLVADGPHALVAGTTGSGKSELLRTLVAGAAIRHSPAQVGFVLVDFKGGGAFDAVAGLPHVSAVVTDLDPAQAMRALRSLRAELLAREHVLREHAVSDLADLSAEVAPPRLVVVVDEFAALAEELPKFLDGLVDVARRGRSLGVHLVLATQRPAGVVTAEIRANTNLRICLRVRDGGDSIDVIDRPDAASLPPIPGRAILTVGGVQHRTIQVAHLAGRSLLEARPFLLDDRGPRQPGDGGWTPRLIEATQRCHPDRVGAPWLPALPATIRADRLWPINAEAGSAVAPYPPLGVLDDPDRRLQLPISWGPADGSLLVAAADPTRVAMTLCTVVVSVVLGDPDIDVLILNGGGGELAVLGILGSVIDVVSHRDSDRLERAVALVDRRRRESAGTGSCRQLVVVINRWGPIADALAEVMGPDAPLMLARLFADGTVVSVVGVTSERELPSKMATQVRRRLVHRLGDANAGLSFDVHPSRMPAGGAAVYDVESQLSGVVADLSEHGLARVAAWSVPAERPAPIRVLSDHMCASQLPMIDVVDDRLVVPVAFDEDLEPVAVELSASRPVVVLGRSGSGRSTALAAFVAGLDRMGAVDRVEVIDDADHLDDATVKDQLAQARAAGRSVVLAAAPAAARSFGSWLVPLLNDATVLLLNPSRFDAEALRVVVPDLSNRPAGRSVILDRGRATIVQIAMPATAA